MYIALLESDTHKMNTSMNTAYDVRILTTKSRPGILSSLYRRKHGMKETGNVRPNTDVTWGFNGVLVHAHPTLLGKWPFLRVTSGNLSVGIQPPINLLSTCFLNLVLHDSRSRNPHAQQLGNPTFSLL